MNNEDLQTIAESVAAKLAANTHICIHAQDWGQILEKLKHMENRTDRWDGLKIAIISAVVSSSTTALILKFFGA